MDARTEPQSSITERQEVIFSWIGACLLNLQNCERLVKEILSSHQLSSPLDEIDAVKAKQKQALRKNSLGITIGKLLGSFYQKGVTTERSTTPENLTVPHINISYSVELEDAEFHLVKRQLSELVKTRNLIAHHFVEMFDITSLPGCDAAIAYLIDANEMICARHAELLAHHEAINLLTQHMGSFSPQIKGT